LTSHKILVWFQEQLYNTVIRHICSQISVLFTVTRPNRNQSNLNLLLCQLNSVLFAGTNPNQNHSDLPNAAGHHTVKMYLAWTGKVSYHNYNVSYLWSLISYWVYTVYV